MSDEQNLCGLPQDKQANFRLHCPNTCLTEIIDISNFDKRFNVLQEAINFRVGEYL